MRTTVEAVGKIIEVEDAIDLAPFIETASALVDTVVAKASETLPSERLELIERYLAAHCYTLRKPRPTSETAGSVSISYQSKVDLNLATSHYGQMAMTLDTSGVLRNLAKNRRQGKVVWLGSDSE